MTFNVLEYCRQLSLPLVFSSTREVYGDVHRFEEYGEAAADFAFTESPTPRRRSPPRRSSTRYARCYGLEVPRLPLLQRLRALRQRPAADGARAAALHPPDRARRADHGLRRRRQGARLHLHRRLRRRHRARHRAHSHDGRVANETINLAYGQGNTLVRAAELIAAGSAIEPQIRQAPSLVGEVTQYVADIRKARDLLGVGAEHAARRRHPTRRGVVPRMAGRAPRGGPPARRGERARRSSTASSSRRRRRLRAGRHRDLRPDGDRQVGRRRGRSPRASTREVVSADSAALYAGLADPDRGARLPGAPRRGRAALGRRLGGRVPAARARGDRRDRRRGPDGGRRRRNRALPAGGAVVARAPAAARAGRARALGARSTTPRGPRGAYALLAAARPRRGRARPRERPPPRRPRARAGRGGASLAPARGPALEPRTCATRRRSSALGLDRGRARPAASRARRRGEVAPASSRKRRPRGRSRSPAPRARCSASRRSPRCRSEEAVEAVVAASRRLARYQRKWLRRLPGAATLDADRRTGGDRG